MLAWMLAAVMLAGMLAGCSNRPAQTGAEETTEGAGISSNGEKNAAGSKKGRFIESELTLPEGIDRIWSMEKGSDGSITLLGQNTESLRVYLLKSSDLGESWDVKDVGLVYEEYITATAVAPDGSAAALGYFSDIDNGDSYVMKQIAADGSVTVTPVAMPEAVGMSIGNMARQAKFSADGRLFVRDMNDELLVVDRASGESKKFLNATGERTAYFGIAGDKLLLVQDGGIPVYSVADASVLPEDVVLTELIKSDASFAQVVSEKIYDVVFTAGMDEGSIVYANSSGVYYHADGAGINEQLVNGALNSLADTTIGLCGIVMMDEENFLLQTEQTGGDKLLRYRYDKNISAVPDIELNVYALKESSLLRQAVALYQKTHQDAYVNLEIGMTGEDQVTQEDAITALSTRIMAGNAPDVLILDGLPRESYIEKGVLADISDVVAQIDEKDELFENVRDAYNRDGVYYSLPASFYMTGISGDEETLDAAKNLTMFADYLEDLREKYPEDAILPEFPAKEFLWILYQADSANWIDEDGSLSEERLTSWLTNAKRIYDVDSHTDELRIGHTLDGMLWGTLPIGCMHMLMESNKLAFGTMTSIANLSDILAAAEQLGSSYELFNTDDGGSFIPYMEAGISNTGEAKEEAKEFLFTLFGTEAGGMGNSGFSINKSIWSELCTQGAEMYGPGGQISSVLSSSDGKEISYTYDDVTVEELDRLTGLLESLKKPALNDAVIEELVLTQAEKYIKGEALLEETVAAIRQKLNLYLSE